MEDPQRKLKQKTITTQCTNALLALAMLFLFYPSLTVEELAVHPKILPAVSQTRTGRRTSPRLQHGISVPGSSPQTAAMPNGNVTLESINERLVRLDENMAGLMQSLGTMQRSVYNLEQLQELLVLLLEDIIKQTGSGDKLPKTDVTPALGSENSGGASLLNDSNEDDSKDATSIENRDDNADDKVTGNSHDMAGVVTGGGKKPAVRNSLVLDQFAHRNGPFGMSAVNQQSNGISARQSLDPNITGGRDATTGDSSQDSGSSSNEDYSGGFMTVMQRSTQPGDAPVPNSRRPQWSEPIMTHDVSNSQARFFDVMHRMFSNLGQSAAGTSPRLLGLIQGSPAAHQRQIETVLHPTTHHGQTESTFEHPPIYEPLEVVPSEEDIRHIHEKKPAPRMRSVKLKLLPESVVSHGGPRTGPEHYSSMYLEHPEEYHGAETSGERPTGMISNLVVHSSPALVTQHDLHDNASQADSTGPIQGRLPVADIRRKRQASNDFIFDVNTYAQTGNLKPMVSSPDHENKQNDSFIVRVINSTSNVIYSENSNSTTTHKYNKKAKHSGSENISMSIDYNERRLEDKGVKENKIEFSEYDDHVASLLTSLSAQLHSMYTHTNASSDDVFSQAIYQLDKLIWVSNNSLSDSPGIFDMANTPFVDGESNHTSDDTEMITSGDSFLPARQVKKINQDEEFAPKIQLQNESNDLRQKNAGDMIGREEIKSSVHGTPLLGRTLNNEMYVYNPEMIQYLNRPGDIQETNITINQNLENGTRNTSNAWDWMHKLMGNFEFPAVDLILLVDALNELSRNESLVDELRELNNRGRALLAMATNTRDNENTSENWQRQVMTNVPEIDNDDEIDNSESTSRGDADSEGDKEVLENEEKPRNTDIVESAVFQESEKDAHSRNVNLKYNVDVKNPSYDEEKNIKSNDSTENGDEGDETDSRDIDESAEKNYHMKQDQLNTNLRPFKIASELISSSKIKIESPSSSTEQAQSDLEDAYINNIRNTFNYDKPSTYESKLRQTNIITKYHPPGKHFQLHSRRKRQTGIIQNKMSHPKLESWRVSHELTYSQTEIPSDKTGIVKTHNNNSMLLGHTHRAENASRNSLHRELQSSNSSQQLDATYLQYKQHDQHNIGMNQSEVDRIHIQGYRQSTSNRHPFDSFVNVHGQTTNNPDYESFESAGNSEAREVPPAEELSALDLEEVLTNLFLTYWQRFYHLYTRTAYVATTPADLDIEEEVTEAALTTVPPQILTSVAEVENATVTSTSAVGVSVDKEFSNTTSAGAGMVGA